MNKIYHIAKGYRKVTIWLALEQRRCAQIEIVPDDAQKTRRQRYEAIADGLKNEGITAPQFQQADASL